jgi:hypothetical protein
MTSIPTSCICSIRCLFSPDFFILVCSEVTSS